MSDVPVQVIIAAFNDEQGADEALKALKQVKKEKMIKIEDAAVLRKDEKGKIHIKETADMGGGKGAVLGGVAGGVLGLVFGPALVVPAAVGALVGGLAAKLHDAGFSNERLQQVSEGLKPGSSAIIAVVEHTWVKEVEKALAEQNADIATEALSADIADQLEAGHDVAYTALATQDGVALARSAGDENYQEGGAVVVGEDEAVGAQYVATPDGFAIQAVDATEDGVTGVQAAGVVDDSEESE
jgi:uncharacterized membrane protein